MRAKTEVIVIPGKTYDTESLQEKFEVIGFSHGYVAVKDKVTGERGSLDFDHSPRIYFNYIKHID